VVRRARRARATLVLALAGVMLRAGPGGAFELPGLGTLLGTENPLATFPESLPAGGFARLELDAHDFYRSRRGTERQIYQTWRARALGLARTGPGWIGVQTEAGDLDILQREVHGRDDALDGGRHDRWVAAAFAARHGGWEARGLLAPSERPEGAIEVRGSGGPFRRILGRAWLRRSSLDFAQRIEGTTFFFPFDYRDECAEAEAEVQPLADHGFTFRGSHKTLVGTKTYPDQHNLLYVDRWSGEGEIRRERGPRADVRALLERSEINLAMTVNGIRYLEARDLVLARRGAEIGWSPFARARLAGGVERWTLRSRHPSYAEIWPFSVWDVFSSTRYRLVAIDKTWQITYVRLTWQSPPDRLLELGVDGRFEWWRDDGALLWKERVPVVYPFFFTYEEHETSLDWPFKNGVDVSSSLAVRPAFGWRLRIAGRIQLPFGDDRRPASAAPPEETGAPAGPKLEARVRGGFSLRTALEVAW
jgi:hypothetical protein